MTADNATLEALYLQLHDRLCRYICARMPGDAEAEDILQDVFLRIHANLDSVRDLSHLEGWIYQVARNSITDYYRRQRRLVELTDLPVEDERLEETAEKEMVPYIRGLVQSLPPEYREALLLTEYEGLTQVELAARLGISISGAKSRVQRARQKVKDMLLTCCHYEFDRRGAILEYRQRCCCCAQD